jgi:hypothetical protein
VSESEDEDNPHWTPHPDLTHGEFSTVTIVFVSALRIYYKKPSEDPIFPADKRVFLLGEKKPWYRNSDPRARPFACVNNMDICLANGTCRPYRAPDDADPQFDMTPELALLYTSLYKTDIFDSIAKRLGRALLAQSLVSQYYSEALSDGSDGRDSQWIQEARNLVKTSLARTQINAWSVASGEDYIHEGRDGYVSVTEGYGDLCGKFKYNPQEYASINYLASILILLSFPVIWILSWDLKPVKEFLKHKLWLLIREQSQQGQSSRGEGPSQSSLPSQVAGVQDQASPASSEELQLPQHRTGQQQIEQSVQESPIETYEAQGSSAEGLTSNNTEEAEIYWEPLLYQAIFICPYELYKLVQRLINSH